VVLRWEWEEVSHCARTKDRYQHDFLARAEIQFKQFWDWYDDDVYVDKDVVACSYEPEDELVDTVVDGCFRVPGRPCT
jgi:hypothetical protein